MIREVIVVEGEHDRQAVSRAVEADCVVTGGHALTPQLMARLKLLQERRGLIILTDPDYSGEQIRRRISNLIPGARHAYLPRRQALHNGDIGIENATPQAIRDALAQVHGGEAPPEEAEAYAPLPWEVMLHLGLTGFPDSAARREALGEALGIGYGNARQFWQRLNSFRVSRSELETAWQRVVGDEW